MRKARHCIHIEIKEEETVDCSKLSLINVTSVVKGKEICHDSMEKVNNNQLSTSKVCDPFDQVIVEEYESDTDDVSNETPIPRVIVKKSIKKQRSSKRC